VNIEQTILEDVGILALKGDFDSFVTDKFMGEVEGLLELGINKVVLNLRFLRFINSTALGCLVKAKKTVQARGGDLVVARPAAFVRSTMDNLGLSDVIQIFDEEDGALNHFQCEKKESGISVDGDNVLMFTLEDPAKAEVLGKGYAVARLTNIVENGLTFVWDGGGRGDGPKEIPIGLFPEGAVVQVKFRLPYYRKSYYFEVTCTTDKGKVTGQGEIMVNCHFRDIKDEDKASIVEFVSEMRFLKKEIEAVTPQKGKKS
jgi:anti-anti-sigma factor